ncbi:hypothetical protein GCM10023189_56680 [Nibrella saemangeumensis]|uniref:Lipocalin-like domain-containing protein n=1 Tax=Nibrella saemangeumensis TaxID=1084526 RepID=A0ABP8NQ58_9BACT
MKTLYFLLLIMVTFSGCRLRERERELERRTTELNQKEQQLTLREQQLNQKEEELTKREKALTSPADSTQDSTVVYNPNLVGRWSVQMRCTETSCEGSAVGDTRSLQWIISYKDNMVFVQALENNRLVRVYTGTFQEGALQLTAQQDPSAANTRMTVRLQFKTANTMEGQREITREGNCRIIYAVGLTKL